MENIKGILFDKDGTLLDFNSMWIPVAVSLVDEIVAELGVDNIFQIKSKLLKHIGVEDGTLKASAILAWGTAEDISEAFKKVLLSEKVEAEKLNELATIVRNKIHKLVIEKAELIKPTGDLIKLLENIMKKNVKIGLATSDSYESTNLCLEQLEIKQYFDFIGTDDGVSKSKPHPEVLNKFCESCGLEPKEIAVVGDTEIDMLLASNGKAALAIAVRSEINGWESIEKKADFIINSVEDLIDTKGNFLWCS